MKVSSIIFFQVQGIPRDCCKYKTKTVNRNALNPIWEETFEIEVHLPELAFIRFSVMDTGSNVTTAQRVVPVSKLRPGYRHLRLHNELDQPLPLSQLFLCSQLADGDLVEDDFDSDGGLNLGDSGLVTSHSNSMPTATIPKTEVPQGRKRMSFLVVHDISEHSPYAILKVPEHATTRDVIRQALIKAGGNGGSEHEYVLLEEVLVPSANGDDFITAPPTQQRMVGMDERPLHLRNKWKSDSKFVLKRVGADPSWRARLGNMIQENNNQVPEIKEDEEGESLEAEETKEPVDIKKDVDNFLVCIFNVSSKVSYSILQVPRTSTATDVITLALSKSRRGEDVGEDDEELRPEKYVLVEETDPPAVLQNYSGNSNGKKGKGKRKRVLDNTENVYLVQLAWKGAGRLILEKKEKLLRDGQFFLDVPGNSHLNVCETQSDPLSGLHLAGKVSPRLRRSSKMIASGVRRISRSFYGGDNSNSSSNSSSAWNLSAPHPHGGDLHARGLSPAGKGQKQRRMTTASANLSPPLFSFSPSADLDDGVPAGGSFKERRRRRQSGDVLLETRAAESPDLRPPTVTVQPEGASFNGTVTHPLGEQSQESQEDPKTRRLSKVNLRKLKIW